MNLELTSEEVEIILLALKLARNDLHRGGPLDAEDEQILRDIKWLEYKIEQAGHQ